MSDNFAFSPVTQSYLAREAKGQLLGKQEGKKKFNLTCVKCKLKNNTYFIGVLKGTNERLHIRHHAF